jgi:hypothetical protein
MHGSMGAGWKRGFGYRASRLPYQYLARAVYGDMADHLCQLAATWQRHR